MAKKRGRPSFIGVDLAWSERNPSGAAVIRKGRLVACTGSLGSTSEILDFVGANLSRRAGSIVAVDAPLRVPNETGSRRCDRTLSADWNRFHAGAHPTNRRLLSNDGVVRGEELTAALTERFQFIESDVIPRKTKARLVCEVYPHPAHVSLFGLERILKYKRGRGRSIEERWPEYERYRTLLRSLRKADPPLRKTRRLLKSTKVTGLRGAALQAYEDSLDALSCAYIASYLWRHGPGALKRYGSLEEGHILVPLPTRRFGRPPDTPRHST